MRERAILRVSWSPPPTRSPPPAFNPQGRQVSQILDEAEGKIFRIGEEARVPRGLPAHGPAGGAADRPRQRAAENGAEDVTGVRTGFYDLDRMTAGLQPGDLIVLAARPSMGKTAFALNIGENVAVNEACRWRCSRWKWAPRSWRCAVGSMGRIDQQQPAHRPPDDEWAPLRGVESSARSACSSTRTRPEPRELRARARGAWRASAASSGLIIVDYLQLMSGSGGQRREPRHRDRRNLARPEGAGQELQCPVIALSQLNRSRRDAHRQAPMMSDLRESGAIEQDADVIMFIYRDDYYNRKSQQGRAPPRSSSASGATGPTGTCKLTFLKPLTGSTTSPGQEATTTLKACCGGPRILYILRYAPPALASPSFLPKRQSRRQGAWHRLGARASLQRAIASEPFDDGWGTLEQLAGEEVLAPPQTQIIEGAPSPSLSEQRSPDIGFDLSSTPYRGCEHGCIYCFARPTHSYQPLARPSTETRIVAKVNAAQRLRARRWRSAYQPLMLSPARPPMPSPAGRAPAARITRAVVEVLAECRHPFSAGHQSRPAWSAIST